MAVLVFGLAAACGASTKGPKAPSIAEKQSSAAQVGDHGTAGELTIVPGTRVAVPLPAGFARKPGALALIHEGTGATITAREMNRPFQDGGLDRDALEPGFVVLSEEGIVLGGMQGHRWELVDRKRTIHAIGLDFGDHEGSFLVIAKVPAEARSSVGADVSHALLGTRVDLELATHFGDGFHAILPSEHEREVRTVQTEDGPVEYTSFVAEATDGVACHLQVTRYSPQNIALMRPGDVDEAVRVGLAEQLDAELLGGRRLRLDPPVMEIEARQSAKQRHVVARYFFTGEALVQLVLFYPQGPEPPVVRTLLDGLLPSVTGR